MCVYASGVTRIRTDRYKEGDVVMEQSTDNASMRKTVLAGVSLALYWAASLVVVSSYALAVHQGSALEPIAGFIGLAGTLAVFGAFPRSISSRAGGMVVRIAAIGGPLLFGIVALVEETGLVVPLFLDMISRALLSAGLGCILSHMGAFLSHLDRLPAALVATTSFFAGALVYLSVSSLGTLANASSSALLACASGVAFVLAGFNERKAVLGEGSQKRELLLSSLPKGFWPLSIGLLLYSMVYGIVIALTLATGGGFAHATPVALALLAPGLIIFVLLVRFRTSFDFRRFQWFLFVPSVIALLPLPFVSVQTGLLLCGILIMVFSFYDLASFVLLVDLARDREPALTMRVFSWGRAANVVGISLGWMIAKHCFNESLGQASDGFILVAYLAVAVLVVLMTFFGNTSFSPVYRPVLTHTSSPEPEEEAPQSTPALTLDEKCDLAAARFGLSAREAEVFKLLAHGRSTSHIANALCISQSTVKTHSYRIYRKLDAHSQQDIIDIAEAAGEDSAGS